MLIGFFVLVGDIFYAAQVREQGRTRTKTKNTSEECNALGSGWCLHSVAMLVCWFPYPALSRWHLPKPMEAGSGEVNNGNLKTWFKFTSHHLFCDPDVVI